jgi:CRP-like cAMP-binding protein
MHWKIKQKFLGRVEIFSNLGQRELKLIAKSCAESTFEDGEFICRQGDRGIAAYIIVSGEINVISEFENGESEIIATLGQGAIVGELAIIDGAERVASIQAKGEVTALVLTQWSMQGLIKQKPIIAASILTIVVKRFRETARELRKLNRDSEHGRKSVLH